MAKNGPKSIFCGFCKLGLLLDPNLAKRTSPGPSKSDFTGSSKIKILYCRLPTRETFRAKYLISWLGYWIDRGFYVFFLVPTWFSKLHKKSTLKFDCIYVSKSMIYPVFSLKFHNYSNTGGT